MQVSYSPINSNETCGICRETVGWGIAHETLHPVHAKCMKAWAQVQATCPTCRAPVDTSSILTLKDRVTNELTGILKDGTLGGICGQFLLESLALTLAVPSKFLHDKERSGPELTEIMKVVIAFIVSTVGVGLLIEGVTGKVREKIRMLETQEGVMPTIVRKFGLIPEMTSKIIGSVVTMIVVAAAKEIHETNSAWVGVGAASACGAGIGLFYNTPVDAERGVLALAGTLLAMGQTPLLHRESLRQISEGAIVTLAPLAAAVGAAALGILKRKKLLFSFL